MKLPYPLNTQYRVAQAPGNQGGCYSHCQQPDLWAYDFGLADGNWTSAVKHGRVIRIDMSSQTGCGTSDCANLANFIVLDHQDGHSSLYYHLKYATNMVSGNEFVYQGQPLAGADNTGWSTATHLHFAIQGIPPAGQAWTDSVQVIFDEAGEPAKDTYPISANRPEWSAQYIGGSQWITLASGETRTMVGQWKNTGYGIWYYNVSGKSVRLGTTIPEPGWDQHSQIGGAASGCAYAATDWALCNRIRPTTDAVAPDDFGWFQFTLKGPAAAGVYKVYLRPLVEGVAWLEDYGVFWQVTRQ